jgi:hypothetical protein
MTPGMKALSDLMKKTDRVHIKGPGTDLRFSIKGIGAAAVWWFAQHPRWRSVFLPGDATALRARSSTTRRPFILAPRSTTSGSCSVKGQDRRGHVQQHQTAERDSR